MKQDTGKYRVNRADQFYTSEAVATSCVTCIMDWLLTPVDTELTIIAEEYLWVEPSAGTGVFLHQLPASITKIGLDIDPKGTDMIKQDYLTWNPNLSIAAGATANKPVIVFGNPPFGRQSSLAKAFIKKSCSFADIIAFILPKSFTKPSMYNVFHPNFHLVLNKELEKNAFILNGEAYDVPCVFQIWKKQATPRPKEEKVAPVGFEYLATATATATATEYDIAVRRVGALAGKCYPAATSASDSGGHRSAQSHYFIRFNDTVVLPEYHAAIIEKVNNHTFPSNTVGPRSLSKSEVNIVLNYIIADVISAMTMT